MIKRGFLIKAIQSITKRQLLRVFTVVVFLLCGTSLFGDGCVHIFDKDMWSLGDEEKQYCAINYKDGYQHMLLTIHLGAGNVKEKTVWIFPVPASPEKTEIDILKGFPDLQGQDVNTYTKSNISYVFSWIRVSQLYLLVWPRGSLFDGIKGETDIYQSVERLGLTTELIDSSGADSLDQYLNEKDLDVPDESRDVLTYYFGKKYSFVVSWVSDEETFNKKNYLQKDKDWHDVAFGVSIKFPTEKIYFPLVPTSVYGRKKIPAVIYVLDYVKPQLFSGIRMGTEINYYSYCKSFVSVELRDFFKGFEIENERLDKMVVRGPGYTKIKIDVPSNRFKEDFWMELSENPLKVQIPKFLKEYQLIYGSFFFQMVLIGIFT